MAKGQEKFKSDSLIIRNDSVFVKTQEIKYEFIGDTLEIYARILQIDQIIEVFEAEQAKLKEQINFFKKNKNEMMRRPMKPKMSNQKKQPARKPKRQ